MTLSMSDLTSAVIWIALYGLVVAGAVQRRIHAGTSLTDLVHGGFDEIPVLQWLLQCACAIAVLATIIECTMSWVSGSLPARTVFGSAIPASFGCAVLMLAASAASVPLLGWITRCRPRGSPVDFTHLEVTRGIRPDETMGARPDSGVERRRGGHPPPLDEWRALAFAGIGLLVLAAALLFFDAPSASSSILETGDVLHFANWAVRCIAAVVPPAALRAVLFPTVACLGILMVDRAVCLTLSALARRSVCLGLLVIVAVCAAALVFDSHAAEVWPGVVAIATLGTGLVAFSLREELDARRTRVREQAAELRESIVEGFPDCVHELDSVARSGLLPPLSVRDVRARIASGLERLEAKSFLIPRVVIRLIKITEVATMPCAAIGLRFLIVCRCISLEKPKPTREARRHPEVDVWDQVEYPILPPTEYEVSDDQRMVLPSSRDVIKACKECGGSGQVWGEERYSDTESFTDFDGNTQSREVTRTRSVLETCGTCSGTGSLRYRQVIVTRWESYEPTLQSSLAVPANDMLDGASELNVLRCPILETFEQATAPRSGLSLPTSLASGVDRAAARALALSARNARLVADHYDGRIYRSELVVSLTHAVHVRYRGLRGGTVWFIGALPETHLRRLPLAWSTLIASALLPPLAIYGLIEGCSLVRALLDFLIGK